MLFCIIQNFCYVLEKRKKKFLNLKNYEKILVPGISCFSAPQKYYLDVERPYKVNLVHVIKSKGLTKKVILENERTNL